MAPELYEEKYNEKVDVYSFGMCILELSTLEYPYAECKNAAQIYRKVTTGVLPAGLSKIENASVREFVELCICHDTEQRPESRQLLKHPFFESIRTGKMSCPGVDKASPPVALLSFLPFFLSFLSSFPSLPYLSTSCACPIPPLNDNRVSCSALTLPLPVSPCATRRPSRSATTTAQLEAAHLGRRRRVSAPRPYLPMTPFTPHTS